MSRIFLTVKYLKNPGTFTLQEKKKEKRKKWKMPSAVLTVCVNGLLKLPLDNCYLVGVKGENMRIRWYAIVSQQS